MYVLAVIVVLEQSNERTEADIATAIIIELVLSHVFPLKLNSDFFICKLRVVYTIHIWLRLYLLRANYNVNEWKILLGCSRVLPKNGQSQ